MMKKKLLILFFASLLVLSGCSNDDDSPGILTTAFYGGTDGVSVDFEEIAPPDQFDSGEEIPVAVVLRNKGEYSIVAGNAKARIYGINTDTFSLSSDYEETRSILRGKGEFNIDGGEQEISFGNLKYDEEIINSRDFTIRAKACYPYQTKTEIPVCIKTSRSEETGEGICSTSEEKVVEGSVSSAPIQVTSVKETLRGSNQVRFDMTIENKGAGNVYSNEATCESLEDDILRLNQENKILLEVINPDGISCSFRTGEESNRGIIELDNGKKIVSCTLETDDTYEDNLRLTLSYMYTTTTSKQITIYEV